MGSSDAAKNLIPLRSPIASLLPAARNDVFFLIFVQYNSACLLKQRIRDEWNKITYKKYSETTKESVFWKTDRQSQETG